MSVTFLVREWPEQRLFRLDKSAGDFPPLFRAKNEKMKKITFFEIFSILGVDRVFLVSYKPPPRFERSGSSLTSWYVLKKGYVDGSRKYLWRLFYVILMYKQKIIM